MWKRRPGAVIEINCAPRVSRRVLNLGCFAKGLRRPVWTLLQIYAEIWERVHFWGDWAQLPKDPSLQEADEAGTGPAHSRPGFSVLLSSAGESEDGGGKQRGVRQHTPPPKVLTGLVTGASRSLHRPDFNTSQHNHEARLGISPSEQSFSEMGIKHVAAEDLIVVGPNC